MSSNSAPNRCLVSLHSVQCKATAVILILIKKAEAAETSEALVNVRGLPMTGRNGTVDEGKKDHDLHNNLV